MKKERYRLSPRKIGTGIEIIVPSEYTALLDRCTQSAPIVREGECEGGAAFVSSENRWGFGGILAKKYRRRDLVFTVNFLGSSLNGAVPRSLNLLIAGLYPPEGDPDTSAPLVDLSNLGTGGRRGGYGLSVTLSPHMIALLGRFSHDHQVRIQHAMQTTMREMGDARQHGFCCHTRHILTLGVPGEEAWLACDGGRKSDGSAQMGDHNIDYPSQQFALLAGLAKAQEIAERIAAAS